MPLSTRYRELKTRLAELRKHFLPRKFSATGQYSDRDLDRARGYRLLAHAEIESYIEDRSREVVLHAIREWKSSQSPSITIVSLLGSYHSSWSVDDPVSNEQIVQIAKSRKNMKDSVNEIIDLAQIQYITLVKNNHGVRETNFKKLVFPTGIDSSSIDQTWMTNLDNFGAKRGEIAHLTRRATSQINPQDEYNLVNSLLIGLKKLDLDMGNL